jgi:hypothetical protein
MSYSSRIHSDPTYTQLLGQAFYNFTYLEWGVLWTIVRLTNNDSSVLSLRETAGQIAKRLLNSIHNTSTPLPASLRLELEESHKLFVTAISTRNKLLHAHPYTALDGGQQLTYMGGTTWSAEDVTRAVIEFENVAIKVTSILNGSLAQVYP